ncbi:MAG: hypothetical protein ACK5W9_01605 [Bdellovibrionales bacterium]
MKTLVYFLISLVLVCTSFAKSEAEVNQEALKDTQKLLRNKNEREKELNTPEARAAVSNMRNLTQGDSKIEQELWELTADVMPLLVEKTDGDPQKMLELLESAKRDPAGFAAQFKGPEQAKLKAVAEKLSKRAAQKKP